MSKGCLHGAGGFKAPAGHVTISTGERATSKKRAGAWTSDALVLFATAMVTNTTRTDKSTDDSTVSCHRCNNAVTLPASSFLPVCDDCIQKIATEAGL
jgi:hypothetical protein